MHKSCHRLQDGSYAPCEAPEDCQLPFHLPMTPAEAESMPLELLLPIFEIMDPPHEIEADGSKVWAKGDLGYHRDYDLPAVIWPEGDCWWFTDGLEHREGGKPSHITTDGFRRWMQHGLYARDDGGPVAIDPHGDHVKITPKEQRRHAREQRHWMRRTGYHKRLQAAREAETTT